MVQQHYHPSVVNSGANAHRDRQSFHHPRTQIGAAGHWIKTVGILSPLIIHEMIKDPEQKWRWIRIASVGTPLLSQALWTSRIHKERQEQATRQEEIAY